MKSSQFSETQIVTILKQADAGMPIHDVGRKSGISAATYFKGKSKYGGLDASELRRSFGSCLVPASAGLDGSG
jgi:putative transposase